MQVGQQDSWKSPRKHEHQERFARDARRVLFVVAIAALALIFVGVLLPPFFRPKTHLFLLGTGKSKSLDLPVIPFADRDLDALVELPLVFTHDQREGLTSASAAKDVLNRLAEVRLGRSDTLILYLSAQGVSQDGNAYLLTDDFQLSDREKGRIELAEVLNAVRESPAKRKLLILNAGTIDYDPRMGLLFNQFPRLLAQAVRQTGDPSLWVLCSHTTGETSNDSIAAGRNVFGMFVTEGLRGAADLNANQTIGLQELVAYVSENVSAWVTQSSEGALAQNPKLYWGGFDLNEQVTDDGSGEDTGFNLLTLGQDRAARAPSAASLVGANRAKKPEVRLVSAGAAIGEKQSGVAQTTNKIVPPEEAGSNLWRLASKAQMRFRHAAIEQNAIENTPQRWRQFQSKLVALDNRSRVGLLGSKFEDRAHLRQLLESFDKPLAKANLSDLNTAQRGDGVFPEQVFSLAFAKRLALSSGIDLQLPLRTLEESLEEPTRESFDKWFKDYGQSEFQRFYEFAILRRLSKSQALTWPTLRVAAKTILQGERVAALDVDNAGWAREQVQLADQYRFFATRLLLAGRDQARAIKLFEQASPLYEAAETRHASLSRIRRRFANVMIEIPEFIRLSRIQTHQASTPVVSTNQLVSLIDNVKFVQACLSDPGEESWRKLERLEGSLAKLTESVRSYTSSTRIFDQLERSDRPGRAVWARHLLQSTLLDAETREALETELPDLERYSARSVKLPELDTIASSESTSSSTSEEGRTASELERLLEIASLEAQWVSLATVGGVDEGANETVQAAHQRLAQETENYRNAGLDEERSHSANERLMNAYAKFGAALTVFYQSISRRILPNGKKTGTEVAVRALRMLDPRDAQPFESSSIAELRRNENLRSTLRWQSSRMRQAARYSDGTDEKTWWNASEEYQRLCLTIPGGEQLLNEPSGQFTINVTDRLNLEDRRRGESAVRLINATASNRSVVLSIDYPENLVAVSVSRSDENRTRIPFHTKRSMLGTKTLGPIAVNSGDSVELSIQFQRLGNASQSSQITIDLIDPSEDYEVAHTNLVKSNLGSNSVLVELPVVELAAKATDATAISDAGGLDLNLFANRTNAIQFGVANQSSRTKRVRVAGYTFESNSQPPSFSNDSIENWTSERKPQVEFDVQAVAGNTSFGNPSAKPPAEKKQSDPTNASGKSKDAAGNPISGMLFSMTDLDTGEVTFRPVTFAIKRPRHFLRPSLRFDSRSNRILVDIAARDATMLPSDKPVRVDCGLAGVPTASTRGRLQGVVSRTSPSTALFINVPPDTYKTLRVLIHVDGYPRAFRYDVPCGVDSGEIEEINDRVDVEMTTDSRQGFLPAMEALPVQIKIDSPAGVFGGKGNELRYGLDTDDSGKPSPATVQSITTDRQVGVSLSESNQSGTVKLFASADDYLVELPTKRLENVELGIAAMLRLKGREQALPKIELFIDSSAPLVGPVRIVGSARVLPKKSLRARVFGFDEASGVRRIEATVVKDDVTEFPADGEFIEALQTEPKHWELEVPVGEKVGGYAILVRAIDRVGNVSEPISQNFEVVSPKPTDSNSKPKLQSVAGQVIFRGQPFASAEVRVELDAKAIQVTQSDTTGTFKLSGLAPGKYQLIAKGLIQNRVRIAKQAVELKPDGTDPLRVPLMLR